VQKDDHDDTMTILATLLHRNVRSIRINAGDA